MTSSHRAGSRLATRLAFWVAGFGLAAWAPLVPFAKQRLQVDDGTLGLLLLCLGIGSVTAMSRTGPLCGRYGSRRVILAGGAGMVVLLPMLTIVSNTGLMALSLLGFGAVLGSLDVAMNVHAVEVERDAGRPLMSGFHALFSVGGFAGSGFVTLMLALSVGPLAATLACSASMAVALGVTAPRLLAHAPENQRSAGGFLALPRGPVALLSVLAAVMFLVEGALLDWSALLLTDTGLTTADQAGLGYAVFAVAMTVGRFGGDAVTGRFGDRAVVLWGGLVVLAGFGMLLLVRRFEVALAAFALIGLGAANVVPVLFRRAGSQTRMPAATAISAVTMFGYAGYLLGPAVLGFVSQQAGLPAAFWTLAGLMSLVPALARPATALPAPASKEAAAR